MLPDQPAATVPTVPTVRPARGLDDLYDIARLAERLGVEHATVRVWLSRRVPWLPPPDGRLNGGAVWRATTLEGIEQRRTKGRPGRKPRLPESPRVVSALPVVVDPTAQPPVAVPTVTAPVPVVAARLHPPL